MTGGAGESSEAGLRPPFIYFLPLLLEGLNLHIRSVQRIVSRVPVKRRGWEIAFLAARLSLPACYGIVLRYLNKVGLAGRDRSAAPRRATPRTHLTTCPRSRAQTTRPPRTILEHSQAPGPGGLLDPRPCQME